MNTAYASKDLLKIGMNMDIWDTVSSASFVVQITLLVLICLSVVCWAVIFAKKIQFGRTIRANENFLSLFWKAGSLEEVNASVDKFKESTVANVFKAGFVELQRIADANQPSKSLQAIKKDATGIPKLMGLDNLTRTLRKASDIEISYLEGRLSILATTGSTGPFIGLFGTVWGIMGAFHKIGATGAASLAVVAPGISEALIATAIGLAAAIPAVVAYNHFITKVQIEELEINNFTSDFLNILKRNFFRDE